MVFTLDWFNGLDLVFEAIGFLVAMLIAAYSWRVYQVSMESRFKYFSLAFLLVSLSLLIKVITSSAVYFTEVRLLADAIARPVFGPERQFSLLFYNAGFFLEMASLLGGWLLIFFISQRSRGRLRKYYELSQMALFVYLVLLISWIANFNKTWFYLTGAVLLSLVVLNYYKNYLNNGNKNTSQIMVAFLLVLLGHLAFVFLEWVPGLYAVGQVLQLAGFITLLYTYMRIIR